MQARKVLLVLGWLSIPDLLPTLVYVAALLTSTGALPAPPAWESGLLSVTSQAVTLAWQGAHPGSGVLRAMLGMFFALLVPWLLFASVAMAPPPVGASRCACTGRPRGNPAGHPGS
jgi:hypothetical protein